MKENNSPPGPPPLPRFNQFRDNWLLANFSQFRKVLITLPSNNTICYLTLWERDSKAILIQNSISAPLHFIPSSYILSWDSYAINLKIKDKIYSYSLSPTLLLMGTNSELPSSSLAPPPFQPGLILYSELSYKLPIYLFPSPIRSFQPSSGCEV